MGSMSPSGPHQLPREPASLGAESEDHGLKCGDKGQHGTQGMEGKEVGVQPSLAQSLSSSRGRLPR